MTWLAQNWETLMTVINMIGLAFLSTKKTTPNKKLND
nr:MAG: hypothetical protein [Microvirus sp.]